MALNGRVVWNPDVYLAFADHRGRPFCDLVAHVGATDPRRVVTWGADRAI
jgi:trans-aconitate 2-methyltransferase